jgi:fructokinase
MNYAGVELGGTKCVAMLARGPDEILARETVPTTTPDETLAALADILGRWQAGDGFEALGIASFGPIEVNPASSTYGLMLTTTKPGWSGTDVLRSLQKASGVSASLDTDVNGAAFAEMRWGSGRGFDDFAYITVGTGVGVGLIVNGSPTRGFGHCELGHIRVRRLSGNDWSGACSFHGDFLQGLASGTALKARLATLSTGSRLTTPSGTRWPGALPSFAMRSSPQRRPFALPWGVGWSTGNRICSTASKRGYARA